MATAKQDLTDPRVQGPHEPMTPAEMSLRGRMGAYAVHARYDSRALTANARRAFLDRFDRQVDPDGILSDEERIRRAELARKAYFSKLALRSAQVRRARRCS